MTSPTKFLTPLKLVSLILLSGLVGNLAAIFVLGIPAVLTWYYGYANSTGGLLLLFGYVVITAITAILFAVEVYDMHEEDKKIFKKMLD